MTIPANVLTKAKNGDKEAKDILCKLSLIKVKRILLNTGADPKELDDLTQDTMIRIFKGLPKLKYNKAFHSYIFCCAHSAWVDYLRKKIRMRKVKYMPVDELKKYLIQDADPNTLMALELILAEALSKMPIHLQRLFFLWKIQNLKMYEIANIFDRSPYYIRKWKADILRRLDMYFFDK